MTDSPPEQAYEDRVAEALKATMDELLRNGWDVVDRKRMRQHWVPYSLLRLEPDLVARRDDEMVVYEAKSRHSDNLSDLDELAKTVAALPKARLEVLWFGDEVTGWPSRDRVRDYVREARELVYSGHGIGAVATAWAAVEGALAYYIADQHIRLPDETARTMLPWRTIVYLDSLGLISERDLATLGELRKQRNAVIHFAGRDKPDAAVIEAALGVAERMANGRYASQDQMVEWFIEDHDYPDVPVSATDQKRVHDLLAEHFPDAPEQEIADAVTTIVHDAAV